MKKRRRGNCCSWRPLCFLAFKTCLGGDFGRQLKRSQQKAEKGPLWLTAVDLTSGKRYEIKEFSIVCGAEKSGRCRRSILFVYWLILDLSISEAYGSLLFFFFFLRSKFTPAEFIRMMDRPAKEKKERGVHLPIRHRLLYMFSTVQPILWLAAIRHIRVCCYYTMVGQLFFLRREYE